MVHSFGHDLFKRRNFFLIRLALTGFPSQPNQSDIRLRPGWVGLKTIFQTIQDGRRRQCNFYRAVF
jgi:hypothetical protein